MSLSKVFKHRLPLSSSEKQTIGEKALLVFDTNVLLSLYRFKPRTRAEAFPLLRRLKGRTWIPHFVGVEFFRNRQQYLTEDANRHDVSRKRVEDAFQALLDEMTDVELDKLGSPLDTDKLRNEIATIRGTFLDELAAVAKRYTALKDNDEVLSLLDELSDGCIGEPFGSQAELDAVYKEGECRYARKQPPGYKDGEKREDEFWQEGLVYKRKFGDLIIWKQLLAAAAKNQKRFATVVLVTQDSKDDWWEKSGHELVGPRPELTEEARSVGITSFHMCSLERLLEQVQKHDTSSTLSEESLQDVKAVAESRIPATATLGQLLSSDDPSALGFMGFASQRAAEKWIAHAHPKSEVLENRGFPDLLVVSTTPNGLKTTEGFEVISPKNPGHLRKLVRINIDAAKATTLALSGVQPPMDRLTFIVVLQPLAVANNAADTWIAAINQVKDLCQREQSIPVISGVLDSGEFVPISD